MMTMYSFKYTSLLLVVLLTHIVMTSALKCFSCDTKKTVSCGKEFKPDKANMCKDGGICRKTITKERGKQSIYTVTQTTRPRLHSVYSNVTTLRSGICRRNSVCLSVTFVHPTQPVEIFGNLPTPFCTLAIR